MLVLHALLRIVQLSCVRLDNYDIKKDNIHKILQDDISKVFIKVLECAGVYQKMQGRRLIMAVHHGQGCIFMICY